MDALVSVDDDLIIDIENFIVLYFNILGAILITVILIFRNLFGYVFVGEDVYRSQVGSLLGTNKFCDGFVGMGVKGVFEHGQPHFPSLRSESDLQWSAQDVRLFFSGV